MSLIHESHAVSSPPPVRRKACMTCGCSTVDHAPGSDIDDDQRMGRLLADSPCSHLTAKVKGGGGLRLYKRNRMIVTNPVVSRKDPTFNTTTYDWAPAGLNQTLVRISTGGWSVGRTLSCRFVLRSATPAVVILGPIVGTRPSRRPFVRSSKSKQKSRAWLSKAEVKKTKNDSVGHMTRYLFHPQVSSRVYFGLVSAGRRASNSLVSIKNRLAYVSGFTAFNYKDDCWEVRSGRGVVGNVTVVELVETDPDPSLHCKMKGKGGFEYVKTKKDERGRDTLRMSWN